MTEIAESVSVDVAKEDPEKYLNVKILEVDFTDSFKTANAKKEVVAPHWPAKTYQSKYSEKPAVLAINKKSKVDIKVKVDSKGVSGDGVLRGSFKGYIFEGKLPLSSGEKTVTVELKKAPDSLTWLEGLIVWGAEGGGLLAAAGTTRVEVFFVFSDPAKMKFFSKDGVWAEALRFLFKNGSVHRVETEEEALKKVTKCCFSIKHHQYDIDAGSTSFGGLSGSFDLSVYMSPKNSDVNCHDQAYAVVVFSGALGLDVDGLFMQPFGYLSLTQLVGRGICNNPFPARKLKSELTRLSSTKEGKRRMKFKPPKPEHYLVVADDDPDRSAFRNHSYCEYKSKIFDACAGPAVGHGDRIKYVKTNVDSATSLNTAYSAGKAHDIISHDRFGRNVKTVT